MSIGHFSRGTVLGAVGGVSMTHTHLLQPLAACKAIGELCQYPYKYSTETQKVKREAEKGQWHPIGILSKDPELT